MISNRTLIQTATQSGGTSVTEKREERRAEWLPFVLGATPIQVALDAIAKAANAPAETKTAPVREPSSDDLVAERGTEPTTAFKIK